MLAYVIRRLGILFLILFGSSFILYNLAAISGDPIGELRFSDDPGAAQAIIDLTRQLRLDVPPPASLLHLAQRRCRSFLGQG